MADDPSWGLVSARITSPTPGEITTFSRQHQLTLGRALSFDVKDPRLSSMEAFLGCVASDLIDTLRRVAREQRLLIDEIELTAEGEVDNPLSHLGVVDEMNGSPALKLLSFKAYASSSEDPATVEAAWQTALLRSPLATTLSKALRFETKLQLVH